MSFDGWSCGKSIRPDMSRPKPETDQEAGQAELRWREERLNGWIHAAGVPLAVLAALWLVGRAIQYGNPWLVVACAVYGLSATGVFLNSALSHLVTRMPARMWYRRLDQGFIYLLIMGTCTPFSMTVFPAWWCWAILGPMWIVALLGFVSKVFWSHRINRISLISYLAVGWIPPLAALPVIDDVPRQALWGIVSGGLLYTGGTWFLKNDRRHRYFHAIWHVMVLVAAGIHFATTLAFTFP